MQGGNSFGEVAYLGNNDAFPLIVKSGNTEVKLLNQRGDGLRVSVVSTAPNTINGSFVNDVAPNVYGVTIGGGGDGYSSSKNQVTGHFGTGR